MASHGCFAHFAGSGGPHRSVGSDRIPQMEIGPMSAKFLPAIVAGLLLGTTALASAQTLVYPQYGYTPYGYIPVYPPAVTFEFGVAPRAYYAPGYYNYCYLSARRAPSNSISSESQTVRAWLKCIKGGSAALFLLPFVQCNSAERNSPPNGNSALRQTGTNNLLQSSYAERGHPASRPPTPFVVKPRPTSGAFSCRLAPQRRFEVGTIGERKDCVQAKQNDGVCACLNAC